MRTFALSLPIVFTLACSQPAAPPAVPQAVVSATEKTPVAPPKKVEQGPLLPKKIADWNKETVEAVFKKLGYSMASWSASGPMNTYLGKKDEQRLKLSTRTFTDSTRELFINRLKNDGAATRVVGEHIVAVILSPKQEDTTAAKELLNQLLGAE